MRRALLLTLSVAFLLGLYAHAAPAAHAEDYGFDDPIVMIDGQIVQILVGVAGRPEDVRRQVEMAHVTIYVPPGTDARVLKSTNTYFSEEVKFVTAGSPASNTGRNNRGNNGRGNNNSNGNNGNNGNGNSNVRSNSGGNTSSSTSTSANTSTSGAGNGGKDNPDAGASGGGSNTGSGANGGNDPTPVTVVVTFDASATLPAALRIIHPGGMLQDQSTTRGRLSASFVLR